MSIFVESDQLLGYLLGVDFNNAADNIITLRANLYIPTKIRVTNVSAALTVFTAGIFTAAAGGGTELVHDVSQIWSSLSASTKYLDLDFTPAVSNDIFSFTDLYFLVTNPEGSAVTGDIFVFGDTMG